ncbi:MAG: branched-chain amino acid transaminase [Candidatus Micrarchaeaceae archaeon]
MGKSPEEGLFMLTLLLVYFDWYAMSVKYVWVDGKFVNFANAKASVLSHSLQYGSGIFEGIRAYKAKNGVAIFRLDDHVKRFFNSAKIYSMPLGLEHKELKEAIISTVAKNKHEECYIRPFAYYSSTNIGVSSPANVSVIIATVEMPSYFSKQSITCAVSSWRRINSNVMPPEAKGSGNYLNSLIASIEAKRAGADEAIMLTYDGYVAEGPGENVFLVENNKLVTPGKSADILLGITRDSVIKLAESMGIEVEERNVHREELETCDEAFFSGTAAGIVPITEINKQKVGSGKPGPITKAVSDKYMQAVHGELEEFVDWLVYV